MGYHLTDEQKNMLGMDSKTIRALSVRYTNARHRCYASQDPKHVTHYQNKNIKMCEEWLNSRFTFLMWAKPIYRKGLELDRIDNSGNYSPENCTFSTALDSRKNRTNCRSFKVLDAVKLLRENGFSEVFIKQHFPMPK